MLDNENRNDVKVARRGLQDSLAGMPLDSSALTGVSTSMSVPSVPKGGLLVKVCYAGVCYAEGYLRKGVLNPQLPGVEVSGIVSDVCNTLPNSNYIPGEHVILYPDEDLINDGYQEYIAVENINNVVQLPREMPLDVAAMLPGGALQAYSAILKAKPHVEKLQQVKSCVNVLIVGAGGLGLWALKLAQTIIRPDCNNIRMFVADNSIDKLITAQEHGCYDIIHWCEEDHEQYITERTLDACRGGVDVVVDFVSSPRTTQRALRVLNREGLILVGGNTMSEVSINLNSLAAKQQSIVGIPKGTIQQLRELVDAVTMNKVSIPNFSVHNVEDASSVFEELAQCRLTGRALLKFGNQNTSSLANVTDN